MLQYFQVKNKGIFPIIQMPYLYNFHTINNAGIPNSYAFSFIYEWHYDF